MKKKIEALKLATEKLEQAEEEYKAAISEAIGEAKNSGITHTRLAAEIGKTQPYIWQIANGKRLPKKCITEIYNALKKLSEENQ